LAILAAVLVPFLAYVVVSVGAGRASSRVTATYEPRLKRLGAQIDNTRQRVQKLKAELEVAVNKLA
jgi:predicted component of type VI protein secretion system